MSSINSNNVIALDLKDVQEAVYPPERFAAALPGCELAVLCNVNFARPCLPCAQAAGKPIATDVHTISDLDDDYNRDFMAAARILFMSDEKLPGDAVRRLLDDAGVDADGDAICRRRWPRPSRRPISSSSARIS